MEGYVEKIVSATTPSSYYETNRSVEDAFFREALRSN
jgi:hypothetical protein